MCEIWIDVKNVMFNFRHLKIFLALGECTLVVEIGKYSLWKSLTYFEKLCCSEIFYSFLLWQQVLELRRFHRWYFFRIIQGNDWIVTTLKCWLMAASWRCLKFWQLLFIWSLFRFIGENGQKIDEFDKIDNVKK